MTGGFVTVPGAKAYWLRNATVPAALLTGLPPGGQVSADGLVIVDLAIRDGRIAAVVAPVAEPGPGLHVDLQRGQPFRQRAARGADPALEDVGGRMGGIGRHQQDAAALAAGRQRERGRAGRLANAPLAAEEHDLSIDEALQQHGRLPTGECSMPIRRCGSAELASKKS